MDDEEKVLKSLTRTFLNDGFRILTATSGREGVEKIQKEKVSLVISDQRMLEMKGDEFLKQVRKFCTVNRALLIFDECVTGFRTPGGLSSATGAPGWRFLPPCPGNS